MPINIIKNGDKYAPTPNIAKSKWLINSPMVPDKESALVNIVENILNKINMPMVIKIIPKISLSESKQLVPLDLVFFLAKVSPPFLIFLQNL